MDVNHAFEYMIGVLVVIILLFTWFLPTLNGSTGINNTTTLFIGGTNYNWFVPVLAIVILLSIVMYIWRSKAV